MDEQNNVVEFRQKRNLLKEIDHFLTDPVFLLEHKKRMDLRDQFLAEHRQLYLFELKQKIKDGLTIDGQTQLTAEQIKDDHAIKALSMLECENFHLKRRVKEIEGDVETLRDDMRICINSSIELKRMLREQARQIASGAQTQNPTEKAKDGF